MSEKVKTRLELIVLALSGIAAAWGLFGFLVLLPPRIEAIEKRMEAQEISAKEVANATKADHDLLVRIEERLITLQKQIEKKP
jgi:hypothetical protein